MIQANTSPDPTGPGRCFSMMAGALSRGAPPRTSNVPEVPERRKVCNLFSAAVGEPVSKVAPCGKSRKWVKKGGFARKSDQFMGRT